MRIPHTRGDEPKAEWLQHITWVISTVLLAYIDITLSPDMHFLDFRHESEISPVSNRIHRATER